MIRFLPRSLAGQTILVLLFGLTLSHLLSMAIYAGDRTEMLARMDSRHTAARIAEIVRLVEDVPEEWRQPILSAIDGTDLAVQLATEPAVQRDEGARAGLIRDVLRGELGEPARPLAVRVDERAGQHGLQRVEVSARLADGAWLYLRHDEPAPEGMWSRHLLSMALMIGGVLLVSVWTVRRLATPLANLAAAAERLGRNVEAPPLAEEGPDEVRAAAAAFNRMQERLRRLVENRTRMLAAISHDLRTPITLLRLRAEFVEDEAERERMLATLDEMEQMVAAILAFARDDAAREEVRQLDLCALVRSICDDFADAGLPVTCSGLEKVAIEARPVALKRAFTNLVDNAVKYGGNARLSISRHSGMVRVAVEDDGPGIPEEEIAKVVMPFYRLEPSRNRETGGVGLGLSVAAGIVDAHGGRLTLANRPEGGLSAVVELPAEHRA